MSNSTQIKLNFYLEGEHWCKTVIKAVQDWTETKISATVVFEKNTSNELNKLFKIKNLHFLTFLLIVRMYVVGMNIFVVRMSFFVVRRYVFRNWDENTS